MFSRLRVLASRIRGFFAGRRLDEDFQRELASHLEMLTEENIRRGLPPDQARRQARLRLGGAAQLRETQHDLRGLPWLETLLQDVRFGLRMLRKNPGFTAVAVITLALGIGANTAVFSIINGLMLRTLPVRDPGRLVELLHQYPGEPAFNGFSWDAYRLMRDGNHVFSDLIVGSLNSVDCPRGQDAAANRVRRKCRRNFLPIAWVAARSRSLNRP